MSPWPSEVNDEAADLHASATVRRATHCPMPKVPERIPWHFLLPAQGDPNIWVVCVKVWYIIHELNEGLSIVAQPRGSPHLSTHPPLYPSQRQYLSQTHNHIGIFLPQDSGIYIHQRSTMWHRGCCLWPGNCIPTANTGTPGRTLHITFDLQPTLPWRPWGQMGALSPWVILWWHWPHLWAQWFFQSWTDSCFYSPDSGQVIWLGSKM